MGTKCFENKFVFSLKIVFYNFLKQKQTRQFSWTVNMTKILLNFVKENVENFKSGATRNAILWAQAAKIVGCTATQAENRIKFLKKQFNKSKDVAGPKGTGRSPANFEYSIEMEEICGGNPNVVPICLSSSCKF